jgi:phosphohistidine phosphatase
VIAYILRHGTAEDLRPGLDDARRALTTEGRARLQRAQKSWRRLVELPETILVSPLLRAQETAQYFAAAIGFTGEVTTVHDLLPGASPQAALERIRERQLSGDRAVALVGHEPHLGALLGLLLTGSERQPIPLKKGMLVGVELPSVASLVGQLLFALSQRLAGDVARGS